MKRAIVSAGAALLLAAFAAGARAQDTTAAEGARPGEARVPLAQEAVGYDAEGRVALSASLLTQDLAGAPDAPVRNTRVVVRNRSRLFYTYAQGWATFYDERGVRCGEGLWKLEAFAPDEQVEVDTPGLRLVCRPATWRVVATTLLTRTTDVAKPRDPNAPPPPEGGVTGDGDARTAAARNQHQRQDRPHPARQPARSHRRQRARPHRRPAGAVKPKGRKGDGEMGRWGDA